MTVWVIPAAYEAAREAAAANWARSRKPVPQADDRRPCRKRTWRRLNRIRQEHLHDRSPDITNRYGEVAAVDGLSFTVNSGDVTGFLGPNGAGKTDSAI